MWSSSFSSQIVLWPLTYAISYPWMGAVLSYWLYGQKLNLKPRAFLHRESIAKQSQGVNLKCNSCFECASHVGSLILLWEGLCAVPLHPLPKALSVQKEECPHRERIAFPGYFTMLRSPRRCTWFHVPMNAAGSYPSAHSSTRSFRIGRHALWWAIGGVVSSSGPC